MADGHAEHSSGVDARHDSNSPHSLVGVAVREDDVEPAKAIRAIAYLFRGMAILLLLLMVVQVMSGVSGTVALSVGVLFADAVRLIVFGGLLWGAGDLAVIGIKSHYDLRATRILVARMEYVLRVTNVAAGTIPAQGSRADRGR